MKISGKTVCQVKRRFRQCGVMKVKNRECYKRFCSQCLKKRALGHRCNVFPLSDWARRSEKVLFVFYYFETTQNTKGGDALFEHVPNLVCIQQFCAVCEDDVHVGVDCRRCGNRKQFLKRTHRRSHFLRFHIQTVGRQDGGHYP